MLASQTDANVIGYSSRCRSLHSDAVPMNDSLNESTAFQAAPSPQHPISVKSPALSSIVDVASDGPGLDLGAQVGQQPAAAELLSASTTHGSVLDDAGQRQSPESPDRGSVELATPDEPTSTPPTTLATAAPASPHSHSSSANTRTPAEFNGPPKGQESANSFLRDARRILPPAQAKTASRITGIVRRLGSVPAPQVKADIDTFRDTVIALLDLVIQEPQVDAAMFLMTYAKSITRHPKLIAALKSDARYKAALDTLIFDSTPGIDPWPPGSPLAADAPEGEGPAASDHASAGETARPMSGDAALPPRIFQTPSTFSHAVSALVRLHLCPLEFWQALVTCGVPVMHEQPQGPSTPTEAAKKHAHLPTGPDAPHAADAPRRPDWKRKNAVTVMKLTEMLALRYAEQMPAEGLDSRPAQRRPRPSPAPPTLAALREVEEFAVAVVGQLTPEEIAQVLYNFGQARVKPRPDVLCVLEECALGHAAAMSAKSMSQLLAGYVGMRVRPGPLLEDMVTRRLQQTAPGINIHPLSITLLQTAKLGGTLPEPAFSALVVRMAELVTGGSFDTTKFAPRLLWSCAVYSAVHGAGFGRRAGLSAAAWALLQAFAELWEAGRLGCDPDGSTILRQAHYSIEVLSQEHRWQIEEGTAVSRFAAHCRRSAREYAVRQVDVAHMHGMRLKIFQQLQQICGENGACTVSQKVLWGDDAHFSYTVVKTGDRWISVELEVPGNVVCNAAGEVTGVSAKPLLRNWALRRWGGAALSIVEEEWDPATVASASFVECLQTELRARGAPV